MSTAYVGGCACGGLDTPELFRPSVVTYNVRALDWDAVDPQLATFERMPPG
jgi:hypothetical protein